MRGEVSYFLLAVGVTVRDQCNLQGFNSHHPHMWYLYPWGSSCFGSITTNAAPHFPTQLVWAVAVCLFSVDLHSWTVLGVKGLERFSWDLSAHESLRWGRVLSTGLALLSAAFELICRTDGSKIVHFVWWRKWTVCETRAVHCVKMFVHIKECTVHQGCFQFCLLLMSTHQSRAEVSHCHSVFHLRWLILLCLVLVEVNTTSCLLHWAETDPDY